MDTTDTIKNVADSKVAVGYLVEGRGAPAPAMSISWPDQHMAAAHWSLLKLCSRWKVRARYRGKEATLYLEGWGEPIPVTPPVPWFGVLCQTCAAPVYRGKWKLASDGVRVFMQGCRRHGYFVLFAAINEQLSEEHRPVIALLYRGES